MTASFKPPIQPSEPMHAVAYLVSPEPEKRDELLQTRDVADHTHVAWLYEEASSERSAS